MNKLQRRAIDRFKFLMRQDVERTNEYAKSEGTKQSLEFEVQPTDYGIYWIKAEVTYPNAPGSALAILGREHYFVMVGERGKLTAKMYPKSWKQFQGRTFLGIHVAKD